MVEWNSCGGWGDGLCVGDADDWGLGWAVGMGGVGMRVSWEMERGTFQYEVEHRSVALNGRGADFDP